MPTLHWIGKEKVINHHQEVPFRILEHKYHFSAESEQNKEQAEAGTQPAETALNNENAGADTAINTSTKNGINSGNKIIHGDNLEALKSLLPEYEGKVKCIYIDPPYNTGNEGWAYNDNVNHPKLNKWLHKVVGKEGEDLSRHDKWLCMMYPRLQLLHKLLMKSGAIFISIDDNELANLKQILDEIFGAKNLLTNFTWKTEGNFDNQAKIKINHEYILCYAKNSDYFTYPKVVDPNISENSKLFREQIRNTIVKNGPKNPESSITLPVGFPTDFESGIINARDNAWPKFDEDIIVEDFKLVASVSVRSGWSSKNIFEKFINNNLTPVIDTKGQKTSFILTKNGTIEIIKNREEPSHVVSSLQNMGSTQNMSNELKKMEIKFDYPKPVQLIEYLIKIIGGKNSLVLDSFAGSGTTAHAVLNLNKQDDGNRKFILVETEDYAETTTAERVKRVMQGYSNTEGTGGSFDFYKVGEPLFDDYHNLNEYIPTQKIRDYIWYSETKSPAQTALPQDNNYLLGTHEGTAYYFYYEKNALTTLSHEFLSTVGVKAQQYIIYADNCILPKEFMAQHNIVFKKIPRDITRF